MAANITFAKSSVIRSAAQSLNAAHVTRTFASRQAQAVYGYVAPAIRALSGALAEQMAEASRLAVMSTQAGGSGVSQFQCEMRCLV